MNTYLFKRLVICFTLLSSGLMAQSIGVNNPTPDASAALDVVSTSKGVLVPRMTAAQRNLIASPATGLLVFQTDETSGFYFYNGTAWTSLNGSNGQGVPAGGSAGQVLSKTDGTDYNTQWVNDNSWKLNGNTGTGENDYMGNTDNKPINFKVNNTLAGYISAQDTDYNTSFGYKAKAAGLGSVAIGYGAGNSNTSAGYTAVGAGAFENRASLDGVAIGNRAGRNMGGSYNIAIGRNAMQGSSNPINNTGTNNIVLGNSSMLNVTSGYDNIAIGNNNLMNTTTSNGLIAIGKNIDIANRNNVLAIGNDLPNSTFTQENMTRIGNNLNTLTEITGQVKVNAQSTTDNFTLPISRGTANQILSTDGAGATSWVTASSGGASELEKITEGNKTGYRILGRDPARYGDIGINAVDFSVSNGTSTSRGATGTMSFAAGDNTTASGEKSVSMGWSNVASGEASSAFGRNNSSSASNTFSAGWANLAGFNSSVAMGSFNSSTGNSSVAMGTSIYAKAYGEVAVGHFNEDYTPVSTTSRNINDRAFSVGTGYQYYVPEINDNVDVRENGLTVYNSGNTDIGGQLKLNANNPTNNFTLPANRGAANQVLSTDGAGATSWVTPSSGGNGAVTAPILVKLSAGAVTLDDSHHTVIMNTDSPITLPNANTCSGRMYRIVTSFKSTDSSNISTFISIDGTNVSTISGGKTVMIQSNGTNWYQVGQ